MSSQGFSDTNDIAKKSGQETQPAGKSAAQPPLPGESGSLGAPPSNTAPCNSNNDHFVKILRTGIDSLYLSYPGSLFTETAIRLDEFKKFAQSDDLERSALAQFELEGHLFHVSDRGTRKFRYVLADNWYRIEVASLVAKSLPLAYARLSSELLTLPAAPIKYCTSFCTIDSMFICLYPSSPDISWVTKFLAAEPA